MIKEKIPVYKQMILFSTIIFCLLIGVVLSKFIPIVTSAIKEAKQMVKLIGEEDFKQYSTSFVYNNQDEEIFSIRGDKDIRYVLNDEIERSIGNAFVSIEDRSFFEHHGFNIKGILRASVQLIVNKGEVTQGGSSITQQLAKIMYLSNERTWERKVKEMVLTRELEKQFSKEEILEFYINHVYFGNDAYGISTAAYEYFDKDVNDLTLGEMTFLAAIPNNPSLYDPYERFENTIGRKNRILDAMLEEEYISQEEYRKAYKEEIILAKGKDIKRYDPRRSFVLQNVAEIFMELDGFHIQTSFSSNEQQEKYEREYRRYFNEVVKELNRGGYHIFTSFDERLQEEMQTIIDKELSDNKEVNEHGIYNLQGSAVTIDHHTGEILAMVGKRTSEGNYDYLNRAHQITRSNASTMKPIAVYAPAFDQGVYFPSTVFNDDKSEGAPNNSTGYFGDITIRKAIEMSSNTVAYKLAQEIRPTTSIKYLKDMNFAHLVEEDESARKLSLGDLTYGTNVIEVAGAYGALANEGLYNKPVAVTKIVDRSGNILFEYKPENKRIYNESSAFMMTDVLKGVAINGTAKGVVLENSEFASKTGTSGDNKDSWFAGYTPTYTTVVWTGFDMPKEMTKKTYSSTIWQRMMNYVHRNDFDLTFSVPSSVKYTYVDDNGREVPNEEYGKKEIFPVDYSIEKNEEAYRKDKIESFWGNIIDKFKGENKENKDNP